ncbi:glycoside hydrolase family 10 protein [Sphaerisporangium aureirubrum]|uniref:Family 10 glycosylhydrolase n=1 Tax=Sphaerisporangium aureirubrum TaxID=1544736 RepID=A0ABW1NMN0_9ACTN
MRNGLRPLLAAAALAAATTGVAYTFGPGRSTADGDATPAARRAAFSEACQVNATPAKRQLRGVWIATVHNLDWPSKPGLTEERQRADYVKILDAAVRRHFNAVFVQVRPASDALYASPYEPWSQWLTGTVGKNPGWDPLPFLIDEAHKRGLEFHAWFNPYRAAATADLSRLPASHPARQHPSWVVKYQGKAYYNPGLPQVREHTVKIVDDVVRRYDVDGVHFDDYFYPYPVSGVPFADQAAFTKYGKGRSLASWRRDNVNKLIAEVGQAVHAAKPYVKFGVSPFGIWRNKSNDPAGSDTKGLSAYDAIYSDARAWIKARSVDYIMPQLYWPRGFAAADYAKLVPWWANQVKGTGVHLYIGQALYRVGTKDTAAWTKPGELPAHLTLNRKRPEVMGDVYFSATQMLKNPLGVLDRIATDHYSRPALLPLMPARGGARPAAPTGLKAAAGTLSWRPAPGARSYAVYRVSDPASAPCAVDDPRNLLAVLPSVSGAGAAIAAKQGGTYLITALDRLGNESLPATTTLP